VRIGLEDYVDDVALPCILKMIEESTRRDAEKAAEWKREAELQELLIDTISFDDELYVAAPVASGELHAATPVASG
jgi:hypothetical protein